MKKFLLLGLALVGGLSAFAQQDAAVYEPVNGIKCENRWLHARTNDRWTGDYIPFFANYGKVRTASIWKDPATNVEYVALGYSKPVNYPKADGTGEEAIDTATLLLYDLANGTFVKEIQLSYNGEPIKNLLCANQIGTDNFGNLWFAGAVMTTGTTPIKLYKIDSIETGECSLITELALPEDEAAASGRMDYCHIIGDITGQQSHAIFMTPMSSQNGATDRWVYRWKLEQGGSEWVGDFDGYVCWDTSALETYPAGQTVWSGAPSVTIIADEELTGDNFYIDAFLTAPVIYNTTGGMVDGFQNNEAMAPAVGTNGVGEFSINDRPFIVYSLAQYNVSPGCQVRVAELGEGMSFEGMTAMWDIPTAGLGEVSDGGLRIHNIMCQPVTDENGNEGVYMLTFKAHNGFGVYCIADENFVDKEVGIEDIVADDAAEAVYYNLQGVKVNNPENGLYIVKRGNKAVKEVVVK